MQPPAPGLNVQQLQVAGVAPVAGPARGRDTRIGEVIYQEVVNLHNLHKPASRQRIADILKLKLTIVDDHIKRLKDEGRIRLVVNGIYEPTEEFGPDRAISTMELPSGLVKVEVGDDILELNPSEARRLAKQLRGWAVEAEMLHAEKSERSHNSRLDRLEFELRQEKKRSNELAAKLASQGDLNQHMLFSAMG